MPHPFWCTTLSEKLHLFFSIVQWTPFPPRTTGSELDKVCTIIVTYSGLPKVNFLFNWCRSILHDQLIQKFNILGNTRVLLQYIPSSIIFPSIIPHYIKVYIVLPLFEFFLAFAWIIYLNNYINFGNFLQLTSYIFQLYIFTPILIRIIKNKQMKYSRMFWNTVKYSNDYLTPQNLFLTIWRGKVKLYTLLV